MDSITIPRADDLHLHLRQDAMMEAVLPLIHAGGIGRCLVMPNLTPPLVELDRCLAYHDALLALEPRVEFLMTLYLTPDITPAVVEQAAANGITGIKSYPRGVTTNSGAGVEDYRVYDEVFAAMEAQGLVLELHGEVPSNHEQDICVLNAEQHFLAHLRDLHARFPRLRIVLEHVTTAAAVDCVRELGETVAATITAHHLELCVDDWAGQNHNFCKPVAKFPNDRSALRAVVAEGHPRFFLGSDSAPHPRSAKEAACGCAGVFTSPLLLPYLADSFDNMGCLDRLEAFTSEFGALFYGLGQQVHRVTLEKRPQPVPAQYGEVVPFRAGEALAWSIAE